MKLKDLFEAVDLETKVRKDCAFYFSHMGKLPIYMLRGSDSDSMKNGSFRTFKPRTRPLDTPKPIHDAINTFFEEKFGKPFRNGLFVSWDEDQVEPYGHTWVIIPKGEFEWLTSGLFDTYGAFEELASEKGIDPYDDEAIVDLKDDFVDLLKKQKWVHNKKLQECLLKQNEIMVWCPQGYYVFDYEDLPDWLPHHKK